MKNKIVSAALFTLATCSYGVNAAINVGAGIEQHSWEETIAGSPSPKESGQRYSLYINWQQDKDQGMLFGYRGKLYGGKVLYDTYTQQTNIPVSTTTQYTGAAHEGQLLYRNAGQTYKLDYVGGLGLDTWERNIDNRGYSQIEDFLIIYLRGGIHFAPPAQGSGVYGGGGLKYPIHTWEDAHLFSQGYSSNPILKPGKDISFYAELGYRFNQRWHLIGYYDSWRFKESEPVITSRAGVAYAVYQPESRMDTLGLKILYGF